MRLSFFKLKKIKPVSEKIFAATPPRVHDIVAPSSITLLSDHFKLGERFAKSFFIFSYPRYLSAAWLSSIINLDVPLDIGFHIHPVDTSSVLKKLRKKVTEVQAEIAQREEKGLIRDPALETAYQDLERLRDGLQTAQEKMFRLGLYLTVYGNTKEELRETETTLRSILESRLIYLKPALYQQKEGFNSSLPYGLDQISVHTPMNTEPLSSTFPFISFDLSSNDGVLYGVNKHNNSLILFDRFSLENANSTIFAKSGSGKSIRGDEPVLIKDKRGIRLTKIGPLIEGVIKKQGLKQIDEELEGTLNPGLEVYSFSKNLKGNWSKVTVAARKKAPDVFYKFTTRSGREITTTADHNMLILRDGTIVAAKSSQIKTGEFIPLPRSIKADDNSGGKINLLELLAKSRKIYITGAENIIKKNCSLLKNKTVDVKYDKYLYEYQTGRRVPIRYFCALLKTLGIKTNDENLENVKITAKNSRDGCGSSIIFQADESFAKIAGYICSEGTITENAIMISNADNEVLQDIDCSLKKLGIPLFYANRGIVIGSRVFTETVKALGGDGRSGQKKVLPIIFNLRKEVIAKYISAYFEGDGGVEKNRIQISATSKSKRLISEINYLLYYFGIVGRISKTKKKPSNGNWKKRKTYYRLIISGQENIKKFAENINFISQRKRKQLSDISKKEGNTNVDIVPDTAPLLREIVSLFGFQLHNIRDISSIKRGHYNPSPGKLRELIDLIEQRIEKFKDLSSTYKILSDLPDLARIIELGKTNKNLNKTLWQALGQSWRIMKKGQFKPLCRNALKAIEITNGANYCLEEIKDAIYSGFQEMDISVKYYNKSLQPVLVAKPQSNPSYETIRNASWHIWQSYQKTLNNSIPQVEKRLTQLKALANSDLFWDPIAKIEKKKNKKEKHVYDLTVDNEVFLAGHGGMFVHNSYMIKLEILRSLMLGVESIILDPENEYQFLANAVGGSFFNFSLSSENHINPFDLPAPRQDEKPEDVLRSNVVNLVGLLRIMLGGLTPEEDAIIDRALAETYAAKDITPETDPHLWTERVPLMEDFEQVLEGMEGTESLVRRIRKFTKGSFSQFFNQRTNISMDNPFVVFGIRDMEDELRPMAMFMVMRYIWNKVRSELKKRILVVDEAWWLMQSGDGASFLFGICKRARKYWLGVTTITQDVGDFMKSDYGKPIITNSSLQILLKQSPATIEVVQSTFNLTEEEKYLLLEAEVGEGIFFAGQKHVAIRVMASYTEDQIITSSPEEILKIKQAKEKDANA